MCESGYATERFKRSVPSPKNSTITDGEAVDALVLMEFENKAYRMFTYYHIA